MALNFKITAPASASAGREAAPTRTVLLVDDDQGMLFTLRSLFQRQGWHLLEATSVGEAMKLWEANQKYIDAVVTDYQFEETRTGLDLVMFVQGRRRGFPCVVISGTWTPEKTPRDEPQNNVFFRAKPLELRPLIELLTRLTAAGVAPVEEA